MMLLQESSGRKCATTKYDCRVSREVGLACFRSSRAVYVREARGEIWKDEGEVKTGESRGRGVLYKDAGL